MFDWLIGGILNGLGTVDRLADKVRNAFATEWSLLVSFFTEQMQAAAYVSSNAGDVATQSVALMLALYRLGWWIIYQSLPRWAQVIIDQLTAWTIAAIDRAINDVRVTVAALGQWAINEIDKLTVAVHLFEVDALNTIATIWGVLNWVKDRVTQLLQDPDVLAQWLFGSLVRYGLKWVEGNAVALGRWGLGMAVTWVIRGASILEDIIVQIL